MHKLNCFTRLNFLLCDSAAWCSLSVLSRCVFQTLQNFMYTMLRDSNPIAAKLSLDVMGELYTRNIWWVLYYLSVRWTLFWVRPCRLDCFFTWSNLCRRNDAKTVNVITTACFSKVTKVSFFHTENKQGFIYLFIIIASVSALQLLLCISSCLDPCCGS